MRIWSARRDRRKVLAIASGGGHWVQLLRVTPAMNDCEVVYATVSEAYRAQVPGHRFHVITDATRWSKWKLIVSAMQLVAVMLRERPDVVLSTGASPGYFAIRLGKLLGARTIWIDSIANVEHLSLSGQRAGRHADLWLTQWPHLAKPQGPHYAGAVL